MSGAGEDQASPADRASTIPFNYIKSNDFRVIHVDGAIGSITPRGLLHAALYSERMPIPTVMIHKVGPDGRLSSPVEQESRPGVVREVEVSLLLDRNAADSLRIWLTDQIAELDRLAGGTEKKAVNEQ
jgi:hypothetical protein